MKIVPSHVAVLVPSVRKAAEYLKRFDFSIGPEEEWEGEGTREIYVQKHMNNSLLLVEPAKDGPYQRALHKRGPGIHHLAIDVTNIEEFLAGVPGWLLHPVSVRTLKQTKTAWLARPGFPALVEVQERDKLQERPLFVNRLSLAADPALRGLGVAIGCSDILDFHAPPGTLLLGTQSIRIQDLL